MEKQRNEGGAGVCPPHPRLVDSDPLREAGLQGLADGIHG